MNNVYTGKRGPVAVRVLAIVATAALVGCEGTVTVDLGTNAAADPAIDQVFVDLDGIALDGDDGDETLRFDDPVRVNLAELGDGNLLRLFTDEEIKDGRYTSVRLLFASDDDDDNEDVVTLSDGREFTLEVGDGTAGAVEITVDKDDSSRDSVVLTLDLRQSLSYDDGTRTYSLTPLVRGVLAEDSGQIAGNVTASCPGGSLLAQGGAVYLFPGENAEPDDRDGAGVEPYLTTRLAFDAATNTLPAYALGYLPEGDYTIALTCDGDEDDAATDDDLRFQSVANVRVRAEETLTRNFD